VLPLLVEKGYGAIVPELLGYGGTDKPTDLKAYSRKKSVDDLAAILDKEGVSKVVVFGHDHGSAIAARFVQWYPSRSIALVLAAVPYAPPGPTGMDVDAVHAALLPLIKYENFGYWHFFIKNPEAAKIIEAHLESFVSIMFTPPEQWKTHFCPTGVLEKNLLEDYQGPSAPWVTDADKKAATDFLKETGLSGPLMWYKAAASTLNAEEEKDLNVRLTLPYLFLEAQKDAACPPIMSARQGALCDDLTVKSFETGHWIVEEDPKGVAKDVLEWFESKKI